MNTKQAVFQRVNAKNNIPEMFIDPWTRIKTCSRFESRFDLRSLATLLQLNKKLTRKYLLCRLSSWEHDSNLNP